MLYVQIHMDSKSNVDGSSYDDDDTNGEKTPFKNNMTLMSALLNSIYTSLGEKCF